MNLVVVEQCAFVLELKSEKVQEILVERNVWIQVVVGMRME